jgi:hypothetical protein
VQHCCRVQNQMNRPLASVGRTRSDISASMKSSSSSGVQAANSIAMRKAVVPKSKFIAKLFWPVAGNASKSGFLVGWNIRNFIACVATVVTSTKV